MALALEAVTIRDREDVRDLWDNYSDMFKEAYSEVHGGQVDPIVLNVLTSPNIHVCLITDDELILGYLCFGVGNHLFFPERFIVIHSMFIRPKYRKRVSLFRIMNLLKRFTASWSKDIDAITLTVSNTIFNKQQNKDKKFRCDKIYTFKVR